MIKYLEEGFYITAPIKVDMDSKGTGRNEIPMYFDIYRFENEFCLWNNQVNFFEDTLNFEEVLKSQQPTRMNYEIDDSKVILCLSNNVLNTAPYKMNICNDIEKVKIFKKEYIYFIPKYCSKGMKKTYDIKSLIQKMHSNYEGNVPMKKNKINVIRIDVTSNKQSVLSMLVHKDGTLNRQGNGDIPPIKIAAIGKTNGDEFKKLINLIPENDALLEKSIEYSHPEIKGDKVEYKIALLGEQPLMRQYVLTFGQENNEVHQIVKFFDHFIMKAKVLTDEFYQKAIDNDKPLGLHKRPWWKL